MLNQDFKEFVESLNKNNVRYLVVGGYAVAAHGHPRYTKDLDVWIETSKESAANLVKALDEFGFGSFGLQGKDFINPEQIIQLGNPPNQIDVLTSVDGVNFESCFASKVEVVIDDVKPESCVIYSA
jgi:hypothetical protein